MNKKFVSNSNYLLRKILNKQSCVYIIKDFIESVLDIKIKDIELNPYLKSKEKYLPRMENFGIADVRIKTYQNEEINIGLQFIDGLYVQTKIVMYYAQIHLNQLEHDERREFTKTITINLIDFIYYSTKGYDRTIKIKNDINEELEMYVIELPKFIIKDPSNMTKKEEWIAYLKGCEEKTLEKIKKHNKNIDELDKMVNKYWLEERME